MLVASTFFCSDENPAGFFTSFQEADDKISYSFTCTESSSHVVYLNDGVERHGRTVISHGSGVKGHGNNVNNVLKTLLGLSSVTFQEETA